LPDDVQADAATNTLVGCWKKNGGTEMPKKPAKLKGAQPKESHRPEKHIDEAARLSSSVEADKNPADVRNAGRQQNHPPPEEDLGGGDICSLEAEPSTDDDKPLD
jgi:hypothetical protein